MLERAYHKLKRESDFDSIIRDGFRPSTPAERHWLGEGVYFFLDPNGFSWACKWPFDKPESSKGIVVTSIDSGSAIDLRDKDVRKVLCTILNTIKNKYIRSKGWAINEGLAFTILVKDDKIREQLMPGIKIASIIANFDNRYKQYRSKGSRVFGNMPELDVSETTQIQACVIDSSIIGELNLSSEIGG